MSGRTAIVTGGASGIGAAISQRLAADGAAVAIFDRNGDSAKDTAASIEAAGGAAYARFGTVRGQINRTGSKRRRYQEAECPLDSSGALRFCSGRQLSGAGRYSTMLVRSLPAETIEFSVSYASEKRLPFVRCKPENRPFGVPAVANTDLVIG